MASRTAIPDFFELNLECVDVNSCYLRVHIRLQSFLIKDIPYFEGICIFLIVI